VLPPNNGNAHRRLICAVLALFLNTHEQGLFLPFDSSVKFSVSSSQLCEVVGAEVGDALGVTLGLSVALAEGLELAETLGDAVGLLNSVGDVVGDPVGDAVGDAVTGTGALVGDLVNPSAFLVGEQEHVPPSAGSTTSSCDIIPWSS